MILKVDFIKKRLSGHSVRARFNLELELGSVAFLAGPQGSGKTTVLQAIHGSLRPDAGRLVCENQIWFYGDGRQSLEFRERSVAMVSGEGTLAQDRSVRWNISLALAHWPTQSRGMRITEVLARVGLEAKARAQIASLDPVQRWHVALAQAIAPRPSLLLLDEPFRGLLPAQGAGAMRGLRAILGAEKIPAILSLLDAKGLAEVDEQILGIESLPTRRPIFSGAKAVA